MHNCNFSVSQSLSYLISPLIHSHLCMGLLLPLPLLLPHLLWWGVKDKVSFSLSVCFFYLHILISTGALCLQNEIGSYRANFTTSHHQKRKKRQDDDGSSFGFLLSNAICSLPLQYSFICSASLWSEILHMERLLLQQQLSHKDDETEILILCISPHVFSLSLPLTQYFPILSLLLLATLYLINSIVIICCHWQYCSWNQTLLLLLVLFIPPPPLFLFFLFPNIQAR